MDSDPELRHDGSAETHVGEGALLRIEGDGICVWTNYSGGSNSENKARLIWSAGNIVAKNPDEEIRRKMWRIAQVLGARVRGDEGEQYGRDGEMIEEATPPLHEPPSNSMRPWWKFW
ncbi:hypothetical protein [Rhizobium sp. CNPSo 4039]|uniref:hypothetical protein n=1 Tax=Rhizobium sp. CNPSo 4039 TaxID=3021409 RepID=UPI00254B7324|nr:hypothetical protein [Rhizobium sp. CNPSo 4039]MDK4715920.1 hypothetical protein [Rhizobium sp. CNPSo 4039]